MKPDEAIKRIQDHMERHEIGKYPHVKLEEAFEMAIVALKNQFQQSPLELNQMKQLVGFPVWFERLDSTNCGRFRVIQATDNLVESPQIIVFTDGGYEISAEYGKTWVAYLYTNIRIDVETWLSKWERLSTYSECKNCGYLASEKTNFCPYCGKAMNEEARKILEQRLGR